uniref:Uncharacterized protein n=1 Tax=Arundo donax TaxID=35708 RepID=A0A0A8Y1Q2_ARUDO
MDRAHRPPFAVDVWRPPVLLSRRHVSPGLKPKSVPPPLASPSPRHERSRGRPELVHRARRR